MRQARIAQGAREAEPVQKAKAAGGGPADRATKDMLLTQRFARHSSLLVTAIYLHPTDEDLAQSVQKIRC